ncbi:hypothetical protein ABZP36_018199 [Zizania latifolia]
MRHALPWRQATAQQLKYYLDSKPWDLTGFVDLILDQTTEHRCGCIKDLKDYLLAVCGDKDTKKKLKQLLDEKAPAYVSPFCEFPI